MNIQSNAPLSVKTKMNFTADRTDGGRFSNTKPELSRQNLESAEVEVFNARALAQQPTLANEGFALVKHSSGRADWSNKEWVHGAYVASCQQLIKDLTGAKDVVHLFVPVERRVDYKAHDGTSPAAGFAHLDWPRDAYREQAVMACEAHGVKYRNGIVYNVWKAITPPPQSVPLAVADRRTVAPSDLIPGLTYEVEVVVPYLIMAYAAETAPKWYYYPDMTADESLVFIGGDLDPNRPLGCAHTAFEHPDPKMKGVPRGSIETRFVACFD
jgi:hypothetical protein